LISLDIASALEEVGATVIIAPNVQRARELLALRRIAAAVIDPDAFAEARRLCAQLKGMGLPYVVYSGSETVEAGAVFTIAKPALATAIAATVISIFQLAEARPPAFLEQRAMYSDTSAQAPQQQSGDGL
jgi:hypothetical protein